MSWWHMLTHLCVSRNLLGILSTFLASHDDQICADVYYDENADVGVDGIGAHASLVVTREDGFGVKCRRAEK